MLRVAFYYCYAECHYAECRYGECRGNHPMTPFPKFKFIKKYIFNQEVSRMFPNFISFFLEVFFPR
jgi:hypothetical protein